MDGLLLIDKPKGWTSFDVVAKVRGVLRSQGQGRKVEGGEISMLSPSSSAPRPKVKVGHTGTLDPLATGLLVLTLGKYCKRAQEFSKLDKVYEVTMKLGETSTTGDEEGEKTKVSDRIPDQNEVDTIIKRFVGEIEQTPPIYSAIKVDGQRAYKLARAGKEVKLEPRQVTVYQISDINYSYPEVQFTAKVSSGTYIRSLVEDIGQKLDTGAYMTELRRARVGGFEIENALVMSELTSDNLIGHIIKFPEQNS